MTEPLNKKPLPQSLRDESMAIMMGNPGNDRTAFLMEEAARYIESVEKMLDDGLKSIRQNMTSFRRWESASYFDQKIDRTNFDPAMSQVPEESGNVSDGYHTLNELYEHRHMLFLAFLESLTDRPYDMYQPWMSENHHDGTNVPEWFIAGVELRGRMITYHLPMRLWDLAEKIGSGAGQTGIAVLDDAPKWDGHTSADVIKRIRNWLEA